MEDHPALRRGQLIPRIAMTQPAHIDVPYVAHLARLDLTPDEIQTFERQLNDVV